MAPTPPESNAHKEESMPYGDWINELPTGFFLAVHIAALVCANRKTVQSRW